MIRLPPKPAVGSYWRTLRPRPGPRGLLFLLLFPAACLQASSAPSITSATTVYAPVNVSVSYQITATNSPTSYGASNLPSGLSVNTGTGLISGTVTATGTYSTTVSATNGDGTGSATVGWTVNPDPVVLVPSSISATCATVTWAASPGVSAFLLDVSPNSSFSSFLSGYQNRNVGSGSSYLVTGLTSSTTYYYRVRASYAVGTSGYSNVMSFLATEGTLLATNTYNWGSAVGVYSYTVPSEATRLVVKVWGAGASRNGSDEYGKTDGGAGGYVRGAYGVSAGQALNIRVAPQVSSVSAGGHASAAWISGGFQLIGGGGGAAGDSSDYNPGGNGGTAGPTGGSGDGYNGGGGATSSAPGDGGASGGASGSGPMNLTTGTPYSYNGGTGYGGGGAGYYGGGGGGTWGPSGGGGGGGSNYLDLAHGYVPGTGNSFSGCYTSDPHYPTAYCPSRPGTWWPDGSPGGGAVVVLSYIGAAPLTVTEQPQSQSATPGTSVNLTVAYTGHPAPTSIQWRKNGTNISGATSTTLVFASVQSADAGNYTVVLSGPSGNVISNTATLTVVDGPPSAPTGLNYAERTATTVTLIWQPATDDLGVGGYNVYRGGTLIGTTADIVYADSGLSANTTYAYTVKAVDTASQLSTASSTLNVTTTQDFSADSDGDGIPNATETALGTNASSAASAATPSQTQQVIHRPIQ